MSAIIEHHKPLALASIEQAIKSAQLIMYAADKPDKPELRKVLDHLLEAQRIIRPL